MDIDLKALKKSGLFVDEFVFLALINEGEDPLGGDYHWPSGILERMENSMWIKSTDDGYELRGKARDLFINTAGKSAALEVLEYLNARYKEIKPRARGYDAVPSNLKFINARLKEKNTVEELKAVIDTMIVKWRGTKFEDYIRPATLFNAEKFQTYRNFAAESIRKSNTLAL